jgi:hypothetical protein
MFYKRKKKVEKGHFRHWLKNRSECCSPPSSLPQDLTEHEATKAWIKKR